MRLSRCRPCFPASMHPRPRRCRSRSRFMCGLPAAARAGSLLVYGTAKVADEVLAIADFGVRHYLNHWHEADVAGQDALGALGARCSATTQTCQGGQDPRRGRNVRRAAMAGDDFEVIPIPGHTRGDRLSLGQRPPSLPVHRRLGVSARGEWVAAVLDRAIVPPTSKASSSSRARFRRARPWAASAGQPCHAVTDKGDARRRIDAILERVRQGDDHWPALGAADRRACAGAGKGADHGLARAARRPISVPCPICP